MPSFKKHLVIIMLAAALVLPLSISPQPARAFAPDVVAINSAKWVWERIKDIFNASREAVSMDLVERAFNAYMSNLAYSVANELATGGEGGKPLFRIKSIKDTSQQALDAAGGEFISELTKKGFDELGINLCDPSVEVKLSLSLSLIDEQAPPKPACNWTNVKKEWKQFGDSFANNLVKFQLDPRGGAKNIQSFWKGISEESDAANFLKLTAELNQRKSKELQSQQQNAPECQGFIDKATTITKEVKVHCTTLLKMSEEQWDKAVQAEIDKKAKAGDQKTSNIKAFSKIMRDAGSLFVNTLSSKLLKQWIKKGSWSLFGASDSKNLRDDLLARLRGGTDIRQPRGQDIFRDLKTTTLEKVEDYSLLNDFIVCPSEEQARRPDNCVIDTQFAEAISSGKTVSEAIADGTINGNMILIGKDDVLRNNSDNCYKEAFCYSNLVKLRKANIIPIGWELAASRSLVTSPVTLSQAIDCFEDAPTGDCPLQVDNKYAVSGIPHNPLYHLVDGNWVLKAPKAMCEALVYANILESPETTDRQQYCADYKTCLRQDENGDCIGQQYSYCTKSENIWRFKGDICEDGETFAGCLNFSNKEFGDASYIEGSLEYCTADEAGCRRYSQDRRSDGTWILTNIFVDSRDLFLTNRAPECPETEDGCQEYISMAPDIGVNIIKNGSFDVEGTLANNDPMPAWDNWQADDQNGDAIVDDYDPVAGRISVGGLFPAGSHPMSEALVSQAIPLLPNTSYALSVSAARHIGAATARIIVQSCEVGLPCSFNIVSAGGPIPGLGTCVIEAVRPHLAQMWFPGPVWSPANPSLPADGSTLRQTCTFKTKDVPIGDARITVAEAGGAEMNWIDEVKLEVISDLERGASPYSAYGEGGKINMSGDRVMCTAREVGCQGYTPSNGDPLIPAVITQDDLCPAECVGYATFTEQPTVFDLIENPLAPVEYHNFIANTATSCPTSAVGCEEFTNLDAVAQGGEGREYFTSVRQCVLEFEGEPYYTWEGSDVNGYQIRTLLALQSNISNGPCTNVARGGSNCIDTAASAATCLPADMLTDPNCREYFDSGGNPFYRLQDRLIFASNDCHDYRRTISGQLYRIIPGISTSCGAEQNNCRSYYGNTANNIRNVFTDNFENGTYQPWLSNGNTDLSTEALQNNGHSMRLTIINNDSGERPLTGLRNNKKYQLSFWMKSDAFVSELRPRFGIRDSANVLRQVDFNQGQANNFSNIEAGNWHYYTVTQYIDFPGTFLDNAAGSLIFNITGTLNSFTYFDNIVLREISDAVGVIKNSWQTPAVCDQPYDGYHLGCQTYVDTNSKAFNLKSFNRLCREEAIGCAAVIDTHNSDNPLAETFHAGDNSQITIPADNLDYLVPDPGQYCQAIYQGCSALGRPDRDDVTKFTKVYKINDPDQYGTALCMAAAQYCEEFNSAKGLYYFKYPGQETCTYQENVNINGTIFSGWFKTPSIGQPLPEGCSNGRLVPPDPNPLAFNIEDLALDPAAVAACPPDKNLCTVFRDPNDPLGCDVRAETDYCVDQVNNTPATCAAAGKTWFYSRCADYARSTLAACATAGETWTAACQPYYYYDNQNIDESTCLGQADRGAGCVLFYEGNNWNSEHSRVITTYDSNTTYTQSENEDKAVSPVTCDGSQSSCDTNRLIKVINDRQCSEWLSCKSSAAVWDPENRNYVIVCDNIDSCVKYDSSNNITNCKKWAPPLVTPTPLTIQEYQSRASGINNHLTWSDEEYTGYAVPGLLPTRSLVTYDFSNNPDIVDARLVYPVLSNAVCNGNSGEVCSVDINGVGCIVGTAGCIVGTADRYIGECRDEGANHYCWVGPLVGDTATSTFAVQARGYAEKDSPFPSAIELGQSRVPAYEKANVCVGSTASINCENEYNKITYGPSGGSRYYPRSITGVTGVCIAGDQKKVADHEPCETNVFCNSPDRKDPNNPNLKVPSNDGVCALKTKVETFLNWQGICMERDESTPLVSDQGPAQYCNQWYPVNSINGASSLFDNYRGAGYNNPEGQDIQFCVATADYQIESDRIYCGSASGDGCDLLLRVPRGAKINLSAVAGNTDILNYGYLIDGVFNFVPRIPAPDGLSWDRVETLRPRDNPRFTVDNFTAPPAGYPTVPVNSIDTIKNFYNGLIDKYYLDTLPAATLPEGREMSRKRNECRDDYSTEQSMKDNGAWCADGWDGSNATEHVVYFTRSYTNDNCGAFGPHKDKGYVWCNPRPYHYYLKIDRPFTVTCTETNCDAPSKGLVCLFTRPTTQDYLNNPVTAGGYCGLDQSRCAAAATTCTVNTATASCYRYKWVGSAALVPTEADCHGDLNCEFTRCIAQKTIPNGIPIHANDRSPAPPHPFLVPGPNWCSDWGRINKETIYYCSSDDPWDCWNKLVPGSNPPRYMNWDSSFESVTGFSSCYDKILEKVQMPEANIPPKVRAQVGSRILYDYQKRDGVSDALYFDVFGDEDALPVPITGCMVSDVLAGCVADQPWPSVPGIDCTVSPNRCYQMCSTIAQLDAEGDNSWVRTDIWWRDTQAPFGRAVSAPWLSYYFSSAGSFVQNSLVMFDRINTTPPATLLDKYFGAAVGRPGFQPVLVEAPLGTTIGGTLSAATYFSDDYTTLADYRQLGYIFGKVFNLTWDATLNRYLPDTIPVADVNSLVIDVPADPINDAAGVNYNPQILSVCGDDINRQYCKDGSGNAIPGITVNNSTSGNVTGYESLFVATKFFYYAHPDHMPVQSLDVNWGDGAAPTFDSNPGKYKNALPTCSANIPMPRNEGLQGFGGLERACREGYKVLYHDYQYDPLAANNHNCDGLGGRPNINALNPSNPASCYQPEVRVLDQWGQEGRSRYNGWIVVHEHE